MEEIHVRSALSRAEQTLFQWGNCKLQPVAVCGSMMSMLVFVSISVRSFFIELRPSMAGRSLFSATGEVKPNVSVLSLSALGALVAVVNGIVTSLIIEM